MSQQHMPPARLTASVVVAMLFVAGASPVASAEPSAPPSTVPTVIILDASGSMRDDDAPGPRIDAAKRAIRSLVDNLPDSAEVGLVVYGTGTGSGKAEKVAGCTDVKTLVPVGPIDDRAFLGTVDGIAASGYTPIGAALRHAADELPSEGPRSIVLVSDGQDTCVPPPPCEVAEDLAKQGVDLTVHTVGFKVGPAARADLTCIADATGGTYSDADSADALTTSLRAQVEHAIAPYEAEGTPVAGTPSVVVETPLLEPGQYVDTFATGGKGNIGKGTEKYYAVEIPERWTAHAAVTMLMPPGTKEDGGAALNVHIAFSDEQGRRCGPTGYAHMNTTMAIGAPATAVANSATCPEAPTHLWIHRFGGRFQRTPATAEILLRLEPPADATGLPAPEIGKPAKAPLHSSTTVPIEGGLSFNRAVELVPGTTYESAVVSGEFRFYKVPVTWGQHLSYRLDLADRDNTTSKEWTYIRGNWYDPVRTDLAELSAYTMDTGHRDGSAGSFAAGSTEPVRYGSEKYGLDGFYYFVLGPNDPDDDAPFQYPFTFTVDTPGDVEEGPVYDLSAVKPTPNADPTPSPSQGATPAKGEASPVGDVSGGGVPAVVFWALGGGVVLAVGGIAAAVWAHRRRR